MIQVRQSLGEMSPLQSAIAFTSRVRIFTSREIVKPIIDFGVGRHGIQEALEVCPVCTVTGVVTSFIIVLGRCGNSSMNESKIVE